MNNKKLITVIVLMFVMLIGITVYAQSDNTDEGYIKGKFYLESFGIDTSDLQYNSPVTRGFVANAVSKTLFDDMIITPSMTKFADVPSDSPYAGAAYLLSNSGIMQGDGTNFSPQNNITYSQAAKIFVASLGKDVVAIEKGGYPMGYVTVAETDGIFDGITVKSDASLTFGDFAAMYCNFVDCKGFVLGGNNFGTFSKDDTTILQHKMYRCDMKYIEGVVTGNQFGSVTSDDIGQISIEGVTYDFDCEIPNDIIGYHSNAFLTKKGSKYVVTSIMADPCKNTVKTISGTDITDINLSEVKYYENDKLKTLKFNNLSVVRNGKILNTYTKADLTPLNGGIVLIDNNEDNKYDYIYIENKQYYTVARTSPENNVIIFDDGSYEGSTHIYVNPDDDEYYHRIFKSDGTVADFKDIKSEDVIKIEGSRDQHVLRVYIIDNVFDGTLEKIMYDSELPLVVDGKSYGVAKDTSWQDLEDITQLNFNYVYTFTTDGNYIVNIDKVKSVAQYAYVIDTYRESAISTQVKYKLVSEDKQVYAGELADKILYNGDVVAKEKFTPKSGIVIAYKTDSDGKICYIEDAQLYSQKSNKIYTEATGIFYSQTYDYPLFMSENTVVFIVPDSGEDDDYMADIALKNGHTYSCESYNYNEEDSSVSVIVIYDDVKYESPGYIYAQSPVCILKDKISVMDEDGKRVTKLTWLEGMEEKSAIVKNTALMNSISSKLATGDVFQYSLTTRGLIDNINILVCLDQNPEYFHTGAYSKVEQVYGKVIEAEHKTLPRGYVAKFVNIFTLDVDYSAPKSFLVTSSEEAVYYYVYDSKKKQVRAASFDDVMTEDGVLGTFNASEVFIYYYGSPSEAKAVVIKN